MFRRSLSLALFLALFLAPHLHADERLFGYVYEADVLPKGAMEFEQWITNRNGHVYGIYSAFDLRQEFEVGLTDNLTTALYLNSKSEYQSITDDNSSSPTFGTDLTTEEFHFEGFSNEWKVRLLSPETHWLGVVAYAEVGYNGPELELEGKLILQHNLSDSLTLAVNLAVEDELLFEASRQSATTKTELSAGLAYKLLPPLSVGLEARNHREFPGPWDREAFSTWNVGPNIHTAYEKWWATLTVFPQVQGQAQSLSGDGRNLVDAERVETRLVAGVNF